MNLSDFEKRFRDSIGVCFVWNLLSHELYSVRKKVLTIPDNADSLFAPWYLDNSGKPTGYRNKEAIPILISEAATNAEIESEQMTKPRFLGTKLPECPAFQVAPNKFLLLDGNHRVTAATRDKVNRTLIIWVIEGPLNDELIPDLINWK